VSGWHLGPIAAFDTETSGPHPNSCRLVTACIAWIDGSGTTTPRVREWLADPGVEIPAEAVKVHGITTEKARAEGRPLGDVVPEVADQLLDAAAMGVPVVAYNAMFDFTLLDRETRRLGLWPFGPAMDKAGLVVIDPHVIDKAVDTYRRGPRNLTAVAAHYGVKQDTAHSASGDAVTAARVAWQIARKYPHIAEMPLADLMIWQEAKRREQAQSLAEHFRKQGKPDQVDDSWPWSPLGLKAVA
jgi:DNA polymerase III subunit epsilon